MKGYKASYDMKCNHLTYEVGKTYSINNFQMCSHGFHFCLKAEDVLEYYTYNKSFVLFEVEAGDVVATIGNKSATNTLKIVRIIPPEEYPTLLPNITGDNAITEHIDSNDIVKTVNDKGQITYYKTKYGYEAWYEYDDNGNNIHYKNNDDFECWTTFVNNLPVQYKNSFGEGWTKEYDANGNGIHHKTNTGYEWWREFDDNNNVIHHKGISENGDIDVIDSEWWRTYDANNNEISFKGRNFSTLMEYDDKGNMIHYEDSNGINWTITITD